MFARAVIVALVSTACGSGLAKKAPPPTSDAMSASEIELRVRVAMAEAKRGDGIAELVDLANGRDAKGRVLALRGLGRVGGAQALAVLRDALVVKPVNPNELAMAVDRDREIAAAADAIGIAAALDETPPDPAIDAALGALLSSRSPTVVVAAAGAIGRASDVAIQEQLVAIGRSADEQIAASVATALGRYGRRKLALSPAARALLVELSRADAARVRLVATWAIAREHQPSADAADNGTAALVARVGDADPEVAATAIGGLARRKAAGVNPPVGSDWRVVAEIARYHTREGADAASAAQALAVVEAASKRVEASAPHAHAVMEGLRGPGSAANLALGAKVPPLTRAWIDCLAAVRAARGANVDSFAPVENCGALPDHLRLPLLAGLIEAKAGTVAARQAAVRTLLAHADVRVKAAGLASLAPTWKDGGDRAAAVAALVSAIGAKETLFAGAALEAATALYEVMDAADPHRKTLDDAIAARAVTEKDVELATALYTLVGEQKLAAGIAGCRAGVVGHPASAKSAATCLEKLGEPVPAAPTAIALPPVDVKRVIGQRLVWNVETSRGGISIELLPDRAPWAVATIVALTEKGYYDGLELHRVVPNFVVQGGDPTESGWGGPGFMIPSEPSPDPGFVTGGVGVADAGRDSGGSQWFVMHGPAPHLDGRYTYFGRVIAGQAVADALVVGDEVVKATVSLPRDRTR